MIDKFSDYLDDVGASRTVRARIAEIAQIYANLGLTEIGDVFLTDYVNDDGVRQFQNLWLFTEDAILEAKLFLEKENVDWIPRKRPIVYWRFESERYGYSQAIDASRLTLKINFDYPANGELKASSGNCDHLIRIFKKYLVEGPPNGQ